MDPLNPDLAVQSGQDHWWVPASDLQSVETQTSSGQLIKEHVSGPSKAAQTGICGCRCSTCITSVVVLVPRGPRARSPGLASAWSGVCGTVPQSRGMLPSACPCRTSLSCSGKPRVLQPSPVSLPWERVPDF